MSGCSETDENSEYRSKKEKIGHQNDKDMLSTSSLPESFSRRLKPETRRKNTSDGGKKASGETGEY